MKYFKGKKHVFLHLYRRGIGKSGKYGNMEYGEVIQKI